MKRVFAIFLLMLTLFLCGCNKTFSWKFKKTSSEVEQISIIKIETHLHNAEEIINIPPIKKIEKLHANEFYEDILNLKMKESFRMELPFPQGYCFLIDYGNYEYCILSTTGSGYIYHDEESKILINEPTDFIFNEEEFLNLLNKYLNADNN